jgi:hypothetical protein
VDVGQAMLSLLDENNEYCLGELANAIGFSKSAILKNAKQCDLVSIGWKARKRRGGVKWCRVIRLKQPNACALPLLK